jgi:hypothetical protein
VEPPDRLATTRDHRADDRDDAAGRRDDESRERDRSALRRDDQADRRAVAGRDRTSHLADRVHAARRVLTEHLHRIERGGIGTEAGALIAHDYADIDALLVDVLNELGRSAQDRWQSAADRASSAHDRSASARDRVAAEADRFAAGGDREQSAVERVLSRSSDVVPGRTPTDSSETESLRGRGERAVAESRQRVADSRGLLERGSQADR